MITCSETTSLNTMMIQVQAAEEKCKLTEQFFWHAKTLCYVKADNVTRLTKKSRQKAQAVWNLHNNTEKVEEVEEVKCILEEVMLQAMWQASEEVEEAKRILEETIDKVVIAEDKKKIAEKEKTIALDAFIAACKSTAELLFHENEQYINENYPEVDPNKIKASLSNLLRTRTEHPEFSKRDIIGCLCCKIPCSIRYSNYLTETMSICEPSQDDCSICLEPLSVKQCVKTLCNHIFHRLCMFKTEKMCKFPPCPLCRKHMSVLPQDTDKYHFLQLKQCNCCERHKRRRPREFSSKAAFLYQCSNPLADILMELLRNYDNSISNPKCNCNCRKKMRLYCRILPDEADELDEMEEID